MTNKIAGYSLGLAALASMFGLMAVDIVAIKTWDEVLTPSFVGNMMAHASTVIMAFLGGKLIPSELQNQRQSDSKGIKIANPWEGE